VTSAELWARALKVIPGGVNSPVRAMKAVGLEVPLFARRAKGAYLEDVEGRRYVDWVMSWGPLIFGHADPETIDAVVQAARDGTTFGTATEREVELGEEIVAAVPSVEMVRLVSSGTEAAMTALRLARAVTGREPFVRFAGGYHGHADPFLSEAGSGVRTLGIEAAAEGRVVPYNDLDAVEGVIKGAACVFVEPVAGNMGVVAPADGFLEGLRRLCDQSGALLVFDEVITGFRVARGGAQERYGVLPDLTVLGKIVGGGLPLAAFGGRTELMERLAPAGDVYQAGTLSGNPLATAAGLSVLRRLTPAVYEELERKGQRLDALGKYGRFERVGAMATLFVDDYPALFRHVLERGIYLAPSQNEAMFLSTAHGDEEIDRTVEPVKEAVVETGSFENR
jgi:glutamate-1-semialdehyde 2,1-aminomutase